MNRSALIIGITGSFGGSVAQALRAHGWRLRALHRRPEDAAASLPRGLPVDWIEGDAMNRDAVVAAASGVQVIVHAVNPPGYKNWRGLALPMLSHSLAAAQRSGARLLFPANVYNYGPDAWSHIGEDSPQNPVSRKGAIRVEMEAMLREAPGVRSLILRAGDFFGGRGASSWFETVMIKPGRPLRRIVYPGDRNASHAWAYLPDLAETAAQLLERDDALTQRAHFNFGGHYLPRGGEMITAIRRAAGAELPARPLPWPLLRLGAPFNETLREVLEMRYLWRESVRLDDSRLRAFLGEVPHTPLDEAVRTTLEGLGVRAHYPDPSRVMG